MAEKKKKVPEAIQKYFDHSEKAEKILATVDMHHSEAYTAAANKHLMGEDGLIDYNKLKDEKIGEKFADTMSDFIFDKAATYFGYKKEHEAITKKLKGDVFKKDALMRAYSGSTQSQYRRFIATSKEKYTFQQHTDEKFKGKLMEDVRATVGQAVGSHLNRSHIDDIIKYTDASKFFTTPKDVSLETALKLLNYHKQSGGLPQKDIDKILQLTDGEQYLLKPEYRSDYKPADDKK